MCVHMYVRDWYGYGLYNVYVILTGCAHYCYVTPHSTVVLCSVMVSGLYAYLLIPWLTISLSCHDDDPLSSLHAVTSQRGCLKKRS